MPVFKRQFPSRTGPFIDDGVNFSPEQADGSSAGTSRKPNRQMQRPFAVIENPTTFSAESVFGNVPLRARIVLGPRIGLPISQVTQVNAGFSPEMSAGNKPDRNRARLGPRIPLPLAQTTQINAPFTIDMVAGNVPPRKRKGTSTRFDQPWMDPRSLATGTGAHGSLITTWCGR